MNPEQQKKLETFVRRAVADLPPRPAPRSLETRVLAELERRAALPWWRQSFSHWPVAARAVFLLCSLGVVKMAFMATVWIMAGFDPAQYRAAFAPQFATLDAISTVFQALGDFVALVARNIPLLWLYGGIAFLGTLYFAFFGLGAAAYRALYSNR